MKTLRHPLTFAALALAAALSFEPSSHAAITGQWDFKAGNLNATIGADMGYLDAPTQSGTLFGTTAALGILWFDTEDYLLPADDDATKRLCEMLTQRDIRATFKLVGEKARVLERRGRQDVIA